ncbi:hydrolase 2, exosortase A system-associated [Nitrogeniibacter mangrovi]|uniref:Hydrolase 2, exosortase A system-associated n=1 Tax=Nitrogeniibacter mangrovi TaxID=2016596 RepID=A0A6C1B4W9_9RHOO|nr:hydrolase 2, exosortase A system-associated [Nitrogeniibacter mangrovi]QID18527.1 hydrolase 2, exosortase A system-associated [Nitrogeniibacter mangrovi]
MSEQNARVSTARPMFLDLNGRRLFTLQIVPTGPITGALLYLPPFAEEMNRCRSHVVSQARALAARGYHTLILDPYGTGESEGEITDADWDAWRLDALEAARWLVAETSAPLTLWGIRTGALLAAELVASGDTPPLQQVLFWQPVLDGKLFLNQHLRLRIAAQMFTEGEKETGDTLRNRLNAGETLEIAGYPLTGRLAGQLGSLRMDASVEHLAQVPVCWLEVVAKAGQALALPSRKLIDTLGEAGGRVHVESVACPMIWQLHERAEAPQLETATLALLDTVAGAIQ